MKVFIASKQKRGRINDFQFHWTKDNELLMFNIFMYDHHTCMIGMDTRKATTFIEVKDLDISRDSYKEKIKKSLESAHNRSFDTEKDIQYLDGLCDRMLSLADMFEDGDEVTIKDKKVNSKGGISEPIEIEK